ncbi:DOP1 Protein dopey [Candida maltosa Xu316]|uniref:Cellular morphogenesis regulator, putative n=1 Tax=Candida maltosa (strain Xu316) TaxID=1245528 RepID=M3J7I6_CANMX|nr:Cellular morphogenesis regulator, putative [Candida maltosa Xu316]
MSLLRSNSSRSQQHQLSSKHKKYVQSVEKALASFESLEEWADYIAFLSRLQKALQFTPESTKEPYFVPHALQVSNKLSLCLSPNLPNGVHQKTLVIYESVLERLPESDLNENISIWLPGLLPLFSYCSISVKPLQIKIFRNQIISILTPQTLRYIVSPFLLCLLGGLDDENSEVFNDVLDLVDAFKLKLKDDSHFWQTLFLSIIKNSDKRLGALHWCLRRLPSFVNSKDADGNAILSEEAQLCLKPEPGLLVRAFAISIDDPQSFDIVVARGFFDLLLSHVPVDSEMIAHKIAPKDKEVLIMSCCRITLKKDMSLNRRLWTYFLGPESTGTDPTNKLTRSEYFVEHVEKTLTCGLLKMMNSDDTDVKNDSFKILLPLVTDKWEIGNVITPKLFIPFLKMAYEYRHQEDIMASALTLFDGIESVYIWNDLLKLILEDKDNADYNFEILQFVLKDFNINDEDMITVHVPYMVMCLLADIHVDSKSISSLELLVNLIPGKFFEVLDTNVSVTNSEIIEKISTWYSSRLESEVDNVPFTKEQSVYLIVSLVQDVYLQHKTDTNYCIRLANLLHQIRTYLADSTLELPQDAKLVNSILGLSLPSTYRSADQSGILVAFGISKLLDVFSGLLTYETSNKIFKILLSNLWTAVCSVDPANYQVEAVKAIFEFESHFPIEKIDAGLVELFLGLPENQRVIALENLWVHSLSINESDKILEKPLQVLLDGCSDSGSRNKLFVYEFLKKIIKSGASNRLLKLLTNPILNFEFIYSSRTTLFLEDDLGQFSYYLGLIVKVVEFDFKLMRECFNNELTVMDSKKKIELIEENKWDISTYKVMVLAAIDKFFSLQLSHEILDDTVQLQNYYACIDNCLRLLESLVTGTEANFGELLVSLIQVSTKYLKSDLNSEIIEAIQSKFLQCILHYLERANSLRLDLNLLHVEEQNKNPMLINFIVLGISKSESSISLEKWILLLVKSLYLFGQSVFSVLLILNDTLIKKLKELFDRFSHWEHFKSSEDFSSSTDILFNGLEDLLSISHGYLVTSNFKSQTETQRNSTSETGFLNTVISGVFQLESPAIRSSEKNKLYSILLAIHDAVGISYKIWSWSDSKPVVPESVTYYSERSLTYVSHKLKFRARKFLESMLELEKQEVVETLVLSNGSTDSKLKLLNILDGGRPQVTLPSLVSGLLAKCNSQLSTEVPSTTIDVEISPKELSSFLVAFLDMVDNDSVMDIWSIIISFLGDVSNNFNDFNDVLSDCLVMCDILAKKLASSKNREAKYSKELVDVFSRLFNQVVNLKYFLKGDYLLVNSSHEKEFKIAENNFQALCQIIVDLDIITQDSDKAQSLISSLVSNFIIPRTRSKSEPNNSPEIPALLNAIGGKYSNSRSWKTLVFDLFMDKTFFINILPHSNVWNSIINKWISTDRDKFGDILGKITTASTPSPSNLFVWNEISEIENKANLLKRLTYLILVSPKDSFLNYLEVLFDKIRILLNGTCPDIIRIAVSALLRAVSLKFDELHLVSKWTLITQELFSIFEDITVKSVKDLGGLSKDYLKLLLYSCKLLDQLLILGYDEVNLKDWLFVSTIQQDHGGDESWYPVIDFISKKFDLTYLKDEPINVEQPSGSLRPLLEGIRNIHSITQLRLFFDSIGLINYERTYGLYPVDYDACTNDVLEDLMG